MIKVIFAALLIPFMVGCATKEPASLQLVDDFDWNLREAPPAEPDQKVVEIRRKKRLSVHDAMLLADLSSPALAAQRSDIDLATAALWQAKLYPNPAFLFEFEEWSLSGGDEIGKLSAGLSIPLVISGRIGAATRLAEAEREVTAIEFLGARRALLAEVKRAFLRLLSAKGRLTLAEETRDLARSLQETAQQRFAANAVPEMEVLKASVSLARTEAGLRSAEKEVVVARHALLGLLGVPDWPEVEFLGTLREQYPSIDLAQIRNQALDSHPSIIAALARQEAALRGLELEQSKKWRDWELEFLGGRGPDVDAIIEGGIRIPLPLSDKNQAGIRTAEVRIVRAGFLLDATRNALIPRVVEAHQNFNAAREQAAIFRTTILTQARRALEQTEEGYRAGKFGYLDLLDAQRTHAEARMGHMDVIAELNEAATTLEELSGTQIVPESKEN